MAGTFNVTRPATKISGDDYPPEGQPGSQSNSLVADTAFISAKKPLRPSELEREKGEMPTIAITAAGHPDSTGDKSMAGKTVVMTLREHMKQLADQGLGYLGDMFLKAPQYKGKLDKKFKFKYDEAGKLKEATETDDSGMAMGGAVKWPEAENSSHVPIGSKVGSMGGHGKMLGGAIETDNVPEGYHAMPDGTVMANEAMHDGEDKQTPAGRFKDQGNDTALPADCEYPEGFAEGGSINPAKPSKSSPAPTTQPPAGNSSAPLGAGAMPTPPQKTLSVSMPNKAYGGKVEGYAAGGGVNGPTGKTPGNEGHLPFGDNLQKGGPVHNPSGMLPGNIGHELKNGTSKAEGGPVEASVPEASASSEVTAPEAMLASEGLAEKGKEGKDDMEGPFAEFAKQGVDKALVDEGDRLFSALDEALSKDDSTAIQKYMDELKKFADEVEMKRGEAVKQQNDTKLAASLKEMAASANDLLGAFKSMLAEQGNTPEAMAESALKKDKMNAKMA